jgi:CRISPR/Cas system-associated protein Csm6
MPKAVFAMRLANPIREALEVAALHDMRPPTQLAAKILADHLIREGYLKAEAVQGKAPRGRKGR